LDFGAIFGFGLTPTVELAQPEFFKKNWVEPAHIDVLNKIGPNLLYVPKIKL